MSNNKNKGFGLRSLFGGKVYEEYIRKLEQQYDAYNKNVINDNDDNQQ